MGNYALFLYCIFLQQISITNNNNEILISFSSYISLRVKGTGLTSILNNGLNIPDEIYINGINQSLITTQYNLNHTDNIIKLVWNQKLTTCHNMFNGCDKIIEIDLGNFDSSLVDKISSMFEGCTSLTFINFTNFNTTNVLSMTNTFKDCYFLYTLDLSSFDISQVSNAQSMFYNCKSLFSLDLSSFDTSKLSKMNSMFKNCYNLQYLNIKNFVITNKTEYTDIFYNTGKNLTIIANKNNIELLLNELLNKGINIVDIGEIKESEILKDINIVNTELINEFICSKEKPFLIIDKRNCVNNCDINDIKNNNCILAFNNTYIKEDLKLNEVLRNIKNNNFTRYMLSKENKIEFIIKNFYSEISFNNHNNDYYRCQESIKKSYNDIYLKKYLYFLTITISLKDNNKPKTVYELYYSSDNNSSFYKLDLNKLNDNCFLKTPIIKCSFYSIESILNDKCILCESDYGYFPINDNSNYFVNCSKSNEKNNTKNESTYEIEYSSNYINNTINNQIINTIYNNLSIINKTTENNNFNTTEIDNVNTDDNNIIYNINNSTENVEIFQKIVCPEEKPYELIETQKCIENCSISDMFNDICKINYKEENKTKKEDLGKK